MLLAIFIAVTAWVLGLVLPWWCVAIPGLLFGAMLGTSGQSSFWWGFAGIAGLWLLQTLLSHFVSDGLLTNQMAELFSLPSPILLILITVVIGGLIGGITTLTGYLIKKATLGPEV